MKCSFCIFRPDFASSTNSFRFKILWAFVWEKRNGQAFRLGAEINYINPRMRMIIRFQADTGKQQLSNIGYVNAVIRPDGTKLTAESVPWLFSG